MTTEARTQTVRAEITDGLHPKISKQGAYIRTVERTDGWQDRLRAMIAELPLAGNAGEVRLAMMDGARMVDTRVIERSL